MSTATACPMLPCTPVAVRLRGGALVTSVVVLLLASAPAVLGAQTAVPQDEEAQKEPLAPSLLNNLVVRVFGSVQWEGTDRAATPNSFSLGQLDFFVTSNLSENVSVLAEIVLEGGVETRVQADLERLQFTYRFNDYLNISAGRYHTSIGFYNTAFHHGEFFETPIGRPRVFAFEDEGGVLPIHEVGLKVSGLVPKTRSALRYLVEVGNGRRWDLSTPGATASTLKRDLNGAKATNIGISFRPDGWRGVEVGASYYRDTATDGLDRPSKHQIGAAYVTYRTPSIEVLAERLTHTQRSSDDRQRDSAAYVQVSRAWGRWRPFYRYDHLSIDPGTVFFGNVESSTAQITGLRVDFSEWAGLKTQYERATQGSRRGVDSFRTQLVFVF